MNIYIDFDRTLFDTDLFLNDLENVLELSGITIDKFFDYVNKDKENGFNIYSILNLMAKDIKVDDDVYKKIDKIIENSEHYIYSDVYDFVKKSKSSGYKIFVLTKGNDEFQLLKIRNTDLFDYLDGVIVTLKDKGKLDLNYQESIFIDDNPGEIESIMLKNPKRIIRIKRDGAKYNNILASEKIEEVESLKDIKL